MRFWRRIILAIGVLGLSVMLTGACSSSVKSPEQPRVPSETNPDPQDGAFDDEGYYDDDPASLRGTDPCGSGPQ